MWASGYASRAGNQVMRKSQLALARSDTTMCTNADKTRAAITERLRMLKSSKVGALIAAVTLCALSAPSAGAAEWHTNGDKTFSTTDAGPSRFVIHGPSGALPFECTSSTAIGTLRGPTIAGSSAPGISSVTPLFGPPCAVAGVPGYMATCNAASLNALSYSGGTTLATAGNGVTSGSITNIHCVLAVPGVQCSTVTGSVTAHYINPNPIATGSGRLTVTSTGQQLTATKIGAGCAAIPNGAVTFGKPGAGSTITDITYTVDGPGAPWMFRTP